MRRKGPGGLFLWHYIPPANVDVDINKVLRFDHLWCVESIECELSVKLPSQLKYKSTIARLSSCTDVCFADEEEGKKDDGSWLKTEMLPVERALATNGMTFSILCCNYHLAAILPLTLPSFSFSLQSFFFSLESTPKGLQTIIESSQHPNHFLNQRNFCCNINSSIFLQQPPRKNIQHGRLMARNSLHHPPHAQPPIPQQRHQNQRQQRKIRTHNLRHP
jgi:hypothetical protein